MRSSVEAPSPGPLRWRLRVAAGGLGGWGEVGLMQTQMEGEEPGGDIT